MLSQAGKMLAMKKEERITEEGKVTPKLPAFWLPSLGPESAPTQVKPPSMKTKCKSDTMQMRVATTFFKSIFVFIIIVSLF